MPPIEKMIIPADQVDYADTAAAVDAAADGMKHNVALMRNAHLPQVRGYLADALDKAGATIEASAKVIADAHVAEKKTYFQHEGQVTDERSDIDHKVRLQASELNLKARGQLRDQETTNIFMELSDEMLAGIAAGTIDPATLIDLGPRINEIAAPVPAPETATETW